VPLDINWTLTVHIPQLDALQQTLLDIGAQIMAELTGIQDAIVTLGTQQAAGSDAIAAQLTAIADEISQITAETIQQADLDALAQQIRDAAAVAEKQAADIRANTAQVAGIVPDTPPATPA
jgi:hypothetical protein